MKYFRAFLQSYPPQECDIYPQAFIDNCILRNFDRLNCIIDCLDLIVIDLVFINYDIRVRYADVMIFEAASPQFFDPVNVRIHITPAAVKIRGMDMITSGLPDTS